MPPRMSRRDWIKCAGMGPLAMAVGAADAGERPARKAEHDMDTNGDYLLGRPLTLDPGTHLLANRDLIEDHWNVEWQIGPPELRAEPLVLPPSPWEIGQGLPDILRDRETGRYRMWYTLWHPVSYRHGFMGRSEPGPLPGAYCIGYAESEDGLRWRKPDLDIWTTPDGERTNVVFWGRHGGQLGRILENVPGGKARWAMVYLDMEKGIEGICLAWSDDGIHWERDAANPVLPCMSDCQNNIVFNPRLRRYVLITRPYPHASGICEWDPPGHRHMRRRIAVSTSPDLRDWTPIRVILYPEHGDLPDFDNMTAMAYGNGFVGFLHAFDGDACVEQRMTSYVAFSRDGLCWQRLVEAPFLEQGFSGRGFDERSVIVAGAWLPLDAKRMLLFYAGSARPDTRDPLLGSAVRVAAMTLRRDGFACATAGRRGLTVVRDSATGEQRMAEGDPSAYLFTREFIMPAGGLFLNADAARGAVRVEVVERSTIRPYRGFERGECLPIAADDITAPVRWRNADIATLAGRPVMLRFILEPGARLYAMRLGEGRGRE